MLLQLIRFLNEYEFFSRPFNFTLFDSFVPTWQNKDVPNLHSNIPLVCYYREWEIYNDFIHWLEHAAQGWKYSFHFFFTAFIIFFRISPAISKAWTTFFRKTKPTTGKHCLISFIITIRLQNFICKVELEPPCTASLMNSTTGERCF